MCSVSAHLGCGSLYRLAAAFLAAALTLSMNCLAAYSPIYCLSSGSIYKFQVELFIVSFLSKEGRTYKPTMIIPFFSPKTKLTLPDWQLVAPLYLLSDAQKAELSAPFHLKIPLIHEHNQPGPQSLCSLATKSFESSVLLSIPCVARQGLGALLHSC